MFQLLVEEKTGAEKNAKFDQDFKTLADVLIQETVKNEVGKVFPQLQDNILGEESNKFTNKLGNSLTVEIKETSEGTKELLVKVLDDNETAGKLLADQVNNPIACFPPCRDQREWVFEVREVKSENKKLSLFFEKDRKSVV